MTSQEITTQLESVRRDIADAERRRRICNILIPTFILLGVLTVFMAKAPVRYIAPAMFALSVIINIRTVGMCNETLESLRLRRKALESIKRIDEKMDKIHKVT